MNGNLENLQSLTGKIKSFRIDTTLTKKGMCAESKAVGDTLAAKVNISDIIDDLLSVASDKPLSANQGRLLKKLIDEIDPHYAENVLYNDTNVKDALDKVSKAENIAYDGEKSVQGAIDELKATVGYTSPNRIPYPYYETTKTLDGIEWIDNGNGTVKANGTSSNVARFEMSSRTEKPISLKRGTYLLYGCPSGFSENVYIWVVRTGSDGNIEYLAIDYGDGATFTLDEDCDSIGVQIRINNGVTVENLVFEPMIVPASLGKIPFEPYVGDVQTQINNVGRIIATDYLNVSVNANAEAVVKSYSGLDVGVYIATFTAVGATNSMLSASIYLNNVNIQSSRCFSNSSTASTQTNVSTIFKINSANDVIYFKINSTVTLTDRDGQSIKIMRIA